jgi:hypothetical protein
VLAYLYMGMEALTKAFRRQHCQRANCTESQLAASWGIELKNLDPEVRKRLLFKGDHECYKKAKAASDGLEHGFLTFDKVLSYAQDAYERTASYLRSAIIELTEVEESANQVLFSPKYEQPLQLWKAAKYLRGRLLGQTDKLAAEGQEYPIFRWQSSIKAVTRIDSGDYNLSLNENLTASLGEGVSFQPNSLEVWGPHKYPKIR